jgi:hypothetical protein
MTLMPYTAPVDGASLSYLFSTDNQVDSVTIHIVVKSTLDYLNVGGLTYTVSLDGTPRRVNFNHNLNEQKENIYSVFYPTVARRVVESVVTLPVDKAKAEHLLTLCPENPAIVFEKIVVDAGGYRPSFLFSDESAHKRLP